jgi:hypothetical protein
LTRFGPVQGGAQLGLRPRPQPARVIVDSDRPAAPQTRPELDGAGPSGPPPTSSLIFSASALRPPRTSRPCWAGRIRLHGAEKLRAVTAALRIGSCMCCCMGRMVRPFTTGAGKKAPRRWEATAYWVPRPSSPLILARFLICSGDWPPTKSTPPSQPPRAKPPYFHDPLPHHKTRPDWPAGGSHGFACRHMRF